MRVPTGRTRHYFRRQAPRDRFLLSTLVVVFLTGLASAAQAAEKVYRVGILAPEGMHAIESFKEGLRQLGWIEGQNIRFDYRTAGGDDARQPALAAELVALPVDLILTWGTPATLAAKHATTTIPIVVGSMGDPVAFGVVPNLAHPGGNVTGFSSQALQIEEKRFELLRDLVPGLTRIVMLGNIGNPYADLAMKRLETVVIAAGLKFEKNRPREWSRRRHGYGATSPSRRRPGSSRASLLLSSHLPADHRIYGGEPAAGDL